MHLQLVRPVVIANPPNPWASTAVEYLPEEPPPEMKLEVYQDHSRQVLAQNDSPDVGFRFSVNPYRGCFHACAYCYARPSHEFLSFGAGTDFERKILVKPRAPELLRQALSRQSWQREMVVFSGVTDCYQPLEASYQLTRRCLEVCADLATPAAVITKAPLVERDIDVFLRLAAVAESHVTISIPFWDPAIARAIEPYVATPERRLRAVARLAAAGVSVGVNVAPIIPGLNDQDMPRILTAAREAGATSAGYVLLRLPGSVREVFVERLRKSLPLVADRVLHLIRETRGGELYDPRFKIRGRGEGPYAAAIAQLFQNTAARLGLRSAHRGTEDDPGGHGKRPATPVATPQLQPRPPAAPSPSPLDRGGEAPAGGQLSLQFPRGASCAGSSSAQSEQSGNIPAR